MLYKIDQHIYPIELYIHIGEDIHETLNQFINDGDRLMTDDNWDQSDAKVYRGIIHKELNVYSLIVAFELVPNGKLIVHELIHLVQRLYEHIGQTNFGDENNAYLMEYLFSEVEKAIKQYNEILV